jgi:hypothetical protein
MYNEHIDPTNYPGSHESYERAGKFLAGERLVEEWGCATTFGRQFIPAPYRGVDGAPSKFVDEVADLSTYMSKTPNALMRHVLEHNWNWRTILANFLASFQEKAVLILFIPAGKHDINRSFEHREGFDPSPPGLQLDEVSLLDLLNRTGLQVMADTELSNDTPPFGYERMFFLEKREDAVPLGAVRPLCTLKGCHRRAGGQVRSDYTILGDRFEYAFNVCSKHQKDMINGLYSLKLPEVAWPRT